MNVSAFVRAAVLVLSFALSTAAYALTGCPSNAVCVNDYATGGSGTSASPWTGWETAVNALPALTHVHFPAGYYSQSQQITMQKGWLITGDGGLATSATTGGATFIVSAFTGTAFYFSAAGNQEAAGIRIEHLTIANTNPSNLGSAIITRLCAIVHISDVWIEGFHYGYTNLGTTSWSVVNSTFDGQTKIGIWNSAGADYKPPYADQDLSGANYAFQNDIGSILNCSFNQNGANANSGVATAAVVLESTYANTIDHCKFNGADHAIWVNGTSVGIRISGSTFEVQQAGIIDLRQSRFVSGAPSGYSGGVVVSNNLASVTVAGVHFIYADQHTDLTLLNNSYAENSGLSMVHSSPGTGIVSLNAFGNSYGPGPLYDSTPGNGVYADYAGLPDIKLIGRLNLLNGINQELRMGSSQLSAGTVTVPNTSVTAKTRVWYFRKTGGGTAGQMSYTTTPGTGFTLTSSSATDTSTYDWFLVEGP